MNKEDSIREVGTQEGYAFWAASYDQENNALIALEEAYVAPLLAQIPFTNVLDVGTGTGRYALKLAREGAGVTALDQSPEMLSVAQQAAQHEHLTIDFQLAPVDNGLPFQADTFDLLVCALMLCHVPDMMRAIEEFARVLQPGGYLLITDFHPDSVHAGWRTQFRQAEIKYLLPNVPHTRDDYLAALTMQGLTILKLIEIPLRALPEGAISKQLIDGHEEQLFCLIILAQKSPSAL